MPSSPAKLLSKFQIRRLRLKVLFHPGLGNAEFNKRYIELPIAVLLPGKSEETKRLIKRESLHSSPGINLSAATSRGSGILSRNINMAIMRLKKGIDVEVRSKSEVSWQRAKIISGNGHTYQVKYESYQPGMAAETERVARKFIRPLPPPVVGSTNWTPGDTVEAFENHSWKLARVSSAPAGDYYFVRIIGSRKQIIVHKYQLRVQQSWKDNHWVINRKDSSRFKDAMVIRRSNVAKDGVALKEHHGLEAAGLRKRGCICFPPVELRMRDSMNHREVGSADALEGNDTHSTSSSVGSCSPCNFSYNSVGFAVHTVPYPSSCHLTICPTQEKSLDHHSELHAYRCTMMALYSSEHFTWEQNAFLTDLRLQLHISNDEHLAEIKHLTSAPSDRESYA